MNVMRSLPEIPQKLSSLIERLNLLSHGSGRHTKTIERVIAIRLHLIHVVLIFLQILDKAIFISSNIIPLEDVHSRIILSHLWHWL